MDAIKEIRVEARDGVDSSKHCITPGMVVVNQLVAFLADLLS
jgi:hypothetical protein